MTFVAFCRFFEASSPEEFLKKNGIRLIEESPPSSINDDSSLIAKCQECKKINQVIPLPCSHVLCEACLKKRVHSVGIEQKLLKRVWNMIQDNFNQKQPVPTCPLNFCNTVIPETLVLQLVEKPKRYEELLVNSLVESDPDFKWCPNAKFGCEKAVKKESPSMTEEIFCSCGQELQFFVELDQILRKFAKFMPWKTAFCNLIYTKARFLSFRFNVKFLSISKFVSYFR